MKQRIKMYAEQMQISRPLVYFFLLQIFFYSGNAGFGPFRVVFLDERGFSNTHIGLILTVTSLVAIVAQPLWGFVSDKIRSLKRTFIFCLITCMVLVPVLAMTQQTSLIFILMIVIMVFMSPFMAFMDTWTVQGLKTIPGDHSYGSIRLWGSVGFMIVVVLLGNLATRRSTDTVFIVYFFMNLLTLLVASLISFSGSTEKGLKRPSDKKQKTGLLKLPFQRKPASGQAEAITTEALSSKEISNETQKGAALVDTSQVQVKELLKNKYFVLFLIASCLVNLSLMFKMTYLPQRVYYAGGDTQLYSWFMSVGAFSEIPMFYLSRLLLKRFRPIHMVLASMGFAIVHIFLLSLPLPPGAMLAIHVLQGFSYGLSVIGNVYYIDEMTPPNLKASGQTLFMAIAMGLAGMLASSLGGVMLDNLGMLTSFTLITIISGGAFVVYALFIIRSKQATFYPDNR